MALAILIEEFETEYGQVRFWISIRVDPGRAPIPSLEIDLPDGSGGGGGKWNTFEPPSLEIRLEDSGALWLYGVVQTDIREVTCGDVVGTIVRPSHCSLAFFALRVGQQRSGQVTFTTEDGFSTARSFEY
jgi:hypothetical protein